MKTKEELDAIKKDIENLNEKFSELSDDELEEVTGGVRYNPNVPLVTTIFPLLATSIGVDGRSPSVGINPEEIMAMDILKDKANKVIYTSSNN